MRWLHYISLTDNARAAFDAGNGTRMGFAVHNGMISTVDENGDPTGWYRVVAGATGEIVHEITSADCYPSSNEDDSADMDDFNASLGSHIDPRDMEVGK